MPARGAGRRPRSDALPPVRKSLGQHFLSDARILTRIVDALGPGADETVVEIGPGRGTLTDILRTRCRRVIAIEYDRALASRLRDRYSDSNVEVIEGDVLATDLGAAAGGPYALIGNVPYYITTPILFHALRHPRPGRAVFLVQREVAERMSARPGTKEYGALSVNLRALARVELVFKVPAGAFSPPPKVESAVVRLTPREHPAVTTAEESGFRALVLAAFGARRKQLRRVLRTLRSLSVEQAEQVLADVQIQPEARPETLDPEQFAALYRRLAAAG